MAENGKGRFGKTQGKKRPFRFVIVSLIRVETVVSNFPPLALMKPARRNSCDISTGQQFRFKRDFQRSFSRTVDKFRAYPKISVLGTYGSYHTKLSILV